MCACVCIEGGLGSVLYYQANILASSSKDPHMYMGQLFFGGGLAFQGVTTLVSCLMGGKGDTESSIFYLPCSGVWWRAAKRTDILISGYVFFALFLRVQPSVSLLASLSLDPTFGLRTATRSGVLEWKGKMCSC